MTTLLLISDHICVSSTSRYWRGNSYRTQSGYVTAGRQQVFGKVTEEENSLHTQYAQHRDIKLPLLAKCFLHRR